MPYRCVHCATTYPDASKEILSGCQCGSKFFFYIKPDKIRNIGEQQMELNQTEKEQIERDVREIAGLQNEPETPIFLDFESIKILKPGKYLIDLAKLFSKGKPRVYHLEDGKYIIDLSIEAQKQEA